MSEILWAGDNRVDTASQRMLRAFLDSEVRNTSELRYEGDLSQNAQVIHRVESHLIPAGLIEEIEREARRGGTKDVRRFRLTEGGREWVEEHEELIVEPVTVDEAREMAREAVKEAESAKGSVQSYRKKVYDLRRKLEAAEERIGELEEQEANQEEVIDMMWARYKRVLPEPQMREAVGEMIEEELQGVAEEREVREVETEVDETQRDVAAVEADVAELREELEGVREEAEGGWFKRMLSR